MLLQILEEGKLTGQRGPHHQLPNTIILLTVQRRFGRHEEVGRDGFGAGGNEMDISGHEESIMDRQRRFPPVLNRLDDMSSPLVDQADLIKFSTSKSRSWPAAPHKNSRSVRRQSDLSWSSAGFDPHTAPRPMRRLERTWKIRWPKSSCAATCTKATHLSRPTRTTKDKLALREPPLPRWAHCE